MAGRVFRVGECLRYGESRSPYPRLRLRLLNVLLEEYPQKLDFIIDTGFEGSLLVTEDIYRFFEVGEIPRKYWRLYRSLSGLIPMRTAKSIVLLDGRRIETYIESPLIGRGKMLVGREMLRFLRLLMDGPRQEVCIAEPINSTTV